MSLVGRLVGNFVLEKKLGEGGMGEVYVARHPGIGRRIAVKILKANSKKDHDSIGRFFNEARAVNQIRHPNVVDIFDFGTSDELAYFTMELLEGEDLGQRMNRSGLTIDDARQIVVDCCSALSACHAAGIVHRDLKPENIFLVRRGGDRFDVKLLDFGIAKLTRLDGNQVRTLTGEIFGTPHYSSPEQAAGASKKATPATDIYSLGVILYELLTGRVPFDGETMTEVLMGHMTLAPRLPSELNPHLGPELENIVMQCLRKEPSERFASADALAAALRDPPKYAASLAGAPGAPTTTERPRRATQRQLHAARTLPIRRATPIPPRAPRFTRGQLRSFGIGLGGATVLIAIGIGLAHLARPTPPLATTPVSSPLPVAPPPAAPTNEIVLATKPENVVVWRGDEKLGKTPLALRIATTAQPFYVQLRADGYEPKLVHIDPAHSRLLQLDLVPITPPAEPARPTSHAPPKTKKPPPGHKTGTDEDALIRTF